MFSFTAAPVIAQEEQTTLLVPIAIAVSQSSFQVRRRIDRLITEPVAIAPPGRGACLEARIGPA
jgi:hypothetical protein